MAYVYFHSNDMHNEGQPVSHSVGEGVCRRGFGRRPPEIGPDRNGVEVEAALMEISRAWQERLGSLLVAPHHPRNPIAREPRKEPPQAADSQRVCEEDQTRRDDRASLRSSHHQLIT